MKTEKKQDCYEVITERIISLLEQGTVPWRKPWKTNGGFPRNLISGKAYRGVNIWLLHAMNYESPLWLTYKQAAELGGNVKRGEKACPVVFWKKWEKENKQTGEKEFFPLMRFYYVFNVAQCENIPADRLPAVPETTPDALPAAFDVSLAESIVTGYKNPPAVKHGMAKAYYSPGGDYVGMPDNGKFVSPGYYYATLFHELAHSTGHVSRLNRPGIMDNAGMGSPAYAREELTAEMTSAFLCGAAGIADTGGLIENSAAYVASWLQALRNDKKLVVQAAGLAQRASDYILNVIPEKQSETQTAPISEQTETVNA